ncbi:hypothetical protein Syun_031324 [Stephania yunnanensis]|uniref:Uncharacterized protein n=1 Tax=Stephania yunnanensis TaxID=152371 RepID=A0AAP0E3S3_9MAGN
MSGLWAQAAQLLRTGEGWRQSPATPNMELLTVRGWGGGSCGGRTRRQRRSGGGGAAAEGSGRGGHFRGIAWRRRAGGRNGSRSGGGGAGDAQLAVQDGDRETASLATTRGWERVCQFGDRESREHESLRETAVRVVKVRGEDREVRIVRCECDV